MPESEKEKFGIRLGWSNLHSGLHALQLGQSVAREIGRSSAFRCLGEVNDSFAFASTGKKMSKVNDQSAEDAYGEAFGLSDVLACYIDFGTTDEDGVIRFSFAKNGQDLGQAFELERTNLDDTRLTFYPHLLVKNVKFQCNFGQAVSDEISSLAATVRRLRLC